MAAAQDSISTKHIQQVIQSVKRGAFQVSTSLRETEEVEDG